MFFKYYLKLGKKNINSSMIYFLIFIVLLNLFTSNKPTVSYEENKINILVNNKDNGELSKKLVEYLKSIQNVTEKNMDEKQAKTLILKKIYNAYIEIDENFEENLINDKNPLKLIGDETSYYFISFKINLEKYLNYQNVALKQNLDYKEIQDTLNTKINVKIKDTTEYNKSSTKPMYNQVFNFLGYAILSSLLYIISNIELSLADENLKKRIKTAPISGLKITVQKYMAQIVIAVLSSALYLVIVNYKVGNFYENKELILLNISTLIHSMCIVAIANTIFNTTTSRALLNGLISILTLIVAFISGIFIPAEFLPKAILITSNFFPTRYYINFINDVSFNNLIKFTATQVLFAIFFISLGMLIKKSKTKINL